MKLQILDDTGHQELELEPTEALQKIQPLSQKYWAFADNEFVEIYTLTESDLANVRELKLTLPLQGGQGTISPAEAG